jgi:hypothetical protein
LARFIDRAAPGDLPALLNGLVPVLGRFRARAEALRSVATYPFVLAVASLVIGAIVLGGVSPAMVELGHLTHDSSAALVLPMTVPTSIALLCTGLLIGLGAILLLRRPLFPFQRGRQRQERALILGAAWAAARTGTDLPEALRSAAQLTVDSGLRHAAEETARGLQTGVPVGAIELMGTVGGGTFAAAAAQGAGVETLGALAEHEEAMAAAEWRGQVLKAELLALMLGGLAIASAGAMFVFSYSRGLIL